MNPPCPHCGGPQGQLFMHQSYFCVAECERGINKEDKLIVYFSTSVRVEDILDLLRRGGSIATFKEEKDARAVATRHGRTKTFRLSCPRSMIMEERGGCVTVALKDGGTADLNKAKITTLPFS